MNLSTDNIIEIIGYLTNVTEVKNFFRSNIQLVPLANNHVILKYISNKFGIPYSRSFKDILEYNKLGSLRLYDYALEIGDERLIIYHREHNLGAAFNTKLAIMYGLRYVLEDLVKHDFKYTSDDGTIARSGYTLESLINELYYNRQYNAIVYLYMKYGDKLGRKLHLVPQDKVIKFITDTNSYDIIKSRHIKEAIQDGNFKELDFFVEHILPENIDDDIIQYLTDSYYHRMQANTLRKRKEQ